MSITAPTSANAYGTVVLGWRVAELYTLADDTGEPAVETLLPAHGSLQPSDQLELSLRTVAGDARRAGVTAARASLDALIVVARAAPESSDATDAFRAQLRRYHIELQRELWELDEAAGKAYELGNGLSDTYGRVCRAYRSAAADVTGTWEDVFSPRRLERLRKLLDDLDPRLNAGGVRVVRAQLVAWGEAVALRLRATGAPSEALVRDGLRRQTIIWLQMVDPEKNLGSFVPTTVRHKAINRQTLRRFIAIFAAVAVLLTVGLYWSQVAAWYEANGAVATGLSSLVISLLAALGISPRAREKVGERLAEDVPLAVVSDHTLLIDAVLPPAPPARQAARLRRRRRRLRGLRTRRGDSS